MSRCAVWRISCTYLSHESADGPPNQDSVGQRAGSLRSSAGWSLTSTDTNACATRFSPAVLVWRCGHSRLCWREPLPCGVCSALRRALVMNEAAEAVADGSPDVAPARPAFLPRRPAYELDGYKFHAMSVPP